MPTMYEPDFSTNTLFGLPEITEALLKAQFVTDHILEPCKDALHACGLYPEIPAHMKDKIAEWHQDLTTISSTLGCLALDLGEKMSRVMVATVKPPPKRTYKPEIGLCPPEIYLSHYELKDLRIDGMELANAICWLNTIRNEASREIEKWESQHSCPFAEDDKFYHIDRFLLHIGDPFGIERLEMLLEDHLERLSGIYLR